MHRLIHGGFFSYVRWSRSGGKISHDPTLGATKNPFMLVSHKGCKLPTRECQPPNLLHWREKATGMLRISSEKCIISRLWRSEIGAFSILWWIIFSLVLLWVPKILGQVPHIPVEVKLGLGFLIAPTRHRSEFWRMETNKTLLGLALNKWIVLGN